MEISSGVAKNETIGPLAGIKPAIPVQHSNHATELQRHSCRALTTSSCINTMHGLKVMPMYVVWV